MVKVRRPANPNPIANANASARPREAAAPALAESPWLSAEQAAQALGVQRSSLYSYVSRGLLRAERLPGERASRYLQIDVARLARERRAVRNPARLAETTLDWGRPVLSSTITLVNDGRLYYRGHDAVQWSEQASLEDTAQLLWGLEPPVDGCPHEPSGQHAAQAAQAVVSTSSLSHAEQDGDVQRRVTTALSRWHAQKGLAQTLAHRTWPQHGRPQPDQLTQYLRLMQHALREGEAREPHTAEEFATLPDRDADRYPDQGPLHLALAQRWSVPAAQAHVLRRALVLSADHELNASSFAVRVVASSGASLHASLGAGLAALSGPLHGGMTQYIDVNWRAWHETTAKSASLERLLSQRQHDGAGYCAGFGHPLYRQGDPRARSLLAQLPPDAARDALLARVLAETGLHPSLDYALVAIRRALHLPADSAFVLFALGRSVGWIAHALEQRCSGQLIRPRANYIGATPETPTTPQVAWLGARRVHFD